MFSQNKTAPTILIIGFALLANLIAFAFLLAPQPARAAPTFTVNSSSDVVASAPLDNGVCETAPGSGVCTLRAAIMKANHYPGGGVTINLPTGTFTLTIPASGSDDELTGDLNITNTMNISGSGTSNTIIDGNHSVTNDRVFSIGSLGSVGISGITIRDGSNNGFGGGISNGRTLTLINSTISSNNANTDGGGIRNWVFATANLFNATITNNQADANSNGSGTGGGVFNQLGGTFNFQNSIIAKNTKVIIVNGFPALSFEDCSGTVASGGYNIMYDTTDCTVNGSVTIADPNLAPLANYGGPTQTHALLAGSPAIDAGDNTLGGCKDNLGATITTDQRGFLRPVNGGVNGLRCDIGAYEYNPNSLFLPLITK